MKKEAEESGSTSTATENVVEKGEVEATKEGEKEKDEDNKNSDRNEKEVDKEKDTSNDQEVVFIQDMGFTVKIVSPGSEPFDIQVSSMELVQVIVRLPNDKIIMSMCTLSKDILIKLLYHYLNCLYQRLELNFVLFYF